VKKVESTNLRLHGICVVGRLPKDTDAHGKRFPGTERRSSARGIFSQVKFFLNSQTWTHEPTKFTTISSENCEVFNLAWLKVLPK
jgi:hypothetical protein